MGIKGFHSFKHLGLAGDGKKDRLFLHEFVLEEGTVQISQLLDCPQPVEVLGNADATAIEVFAGYIGILYKESQDAQHSLPMAEDGGRAINSLEKMELEIPDHPTEDFPFTFSFEDGYVNMPNVGPVKILEVRFEYEISDQQRIMKIDAEGFVRAILKDAQTGSTTLL